MKKNRNKRKAGYLWLSGALVGAALGVAAGMLADSKLGKKLGKKTKVASADFYRYITPKLKRAKRLGEAEYKIFVREAMMRYAKDRKLSGQEAKRLTREVQATWKHLKRNL